MYPVSETFKTYIKKNAVSYSWHGTIVDVEENSYLLSDENIVQSSGKITRRCATDKSFIGTSCASALELSAYLDVDRYKLFGATVTLYFTLYEGEDEQHQPITEDVPMGIYVISECNQAAGKLSFTAYDYMTKFDDVPFNPLSYSSIQYPYNWLSDACTACGVTLGNTQAQIKAMPNGKRPMGYTDVASGVVSWRDILNHITNVLGGFAYIGRDGKLYIGTYTSTSVDTISASFRYSSDLSDYRTTYNGIHNIFKEGGVQEYASNSNENGLVVDIGTNPFLQFTNSNSRLKALQEIINVWEDVYYVPFDVTMPIVPFYDPSDVITFTDNQAAEYDYGAITEIVYAIGGQMSIKCVGDNPRLADAQDHFAKTVEGLSSEYDNTRNIGGKNFWILNTINTSAMTVGNTETQVTEIEWNQKTYVQDLEMIFEVDAVLSATANVQIRMNVDDDTTYEVTTNEIKSLIGERTFVRTNPQKIVGKGVHTAKVYMTVTDSALLVGDLV